MRYVIQFVSDKKYGYVQLKGYGKAGSSNKLAVLVAYVALPFDVQNGSTDINLTWECRLVETDSAKNLGFNGQLLYSPGFFTGNLLRAPIWAFVVSHWHNQPISDLLRRTLIFTLW